MDKDEEMFIKLRQEHESAADLINALLADRYPEVGKVVAMLIAEQTESRPRTDPVLKPVIDKYGINGTTLRSKISHLKTGRKDRPPADLKLSLFLVLLEILDLELVVRQRTEKEPETGYFAKSTAELGTAG